MALIGRVILSSGDEPCFLDNLSLTGASLTIARNAPPIGDHAIMIVDTIEASGVVIWRQATHFGLQFDDPVADDDMLRLRTSQAEFAAIESERHLGTGRNRRVQR